jgi:hypothetical protein
MSQAFDSSRHPRNHGRFASARGAAAIASAPDAVRFGGGMNLSGIPRASAAPARSQTRGEAWQRLGSKMHGIPVHYTGSPQLSKPAGTYSHVRVTQQVPEKTGVEEHLARFHRFISIAKDSREEIMAGAEKSRVGKKHVYLKAHEPASGGRDHWRMKPDKYPEGTPKATLHRAYNHAALMAAHHHGLVDYDFKMDDHLKTELKPTEPFMRYARDELIRRQSAAAPGQRGEYLQAFGTSRKKVSYGKETGAVSHRFRPNQQLVKAFDETKHRRGHGGEFAAGFGAAGGAAIAGGAIAAAPAAHRNALRTYRAKIGDGSVVYRGAPKADPKPRARGFGAVFVSPKRDLASAFARDSGRVSHYSMARGTKLLSVRAHEGSTSHLETESQQKFDAGKYHGTAYKLYGGDKNDDHESTRAKPTAYALKDNSQLKFLRATGGERGFVQKAGVAASRAVRRSRLGRIAALATGAAVAGGAAYGAEHQLGKAFDAQKHKRGKRGRFAAAGDAAIGTGSVLGAIAATHAANYAARPIIARQRVTASRDYRRQLTDAKASGSVIMYRGAPAADPSPRARAFNAVYAATDKDVARGYGKVVSRYALTPGARLLSMHHDDVKPLFDPSMHDALPKDASQRVGHDHRLWRLTDQQHEKLTALGYSGVEVPQLDRHDAYAISDENALRYLGSGYRGGASGSRVLRLANLVRLMPKRYVAYSALSGAGLGIAAADISADKKSRQRVNDIVANAAAAATPWGLAGAVGGALYGAHKTGMLAYTPGTNMATYRRAILTNGARFSGKSFRTVAGLAALSGLGAAAPPAAQQAIMTYIDQLGTGKKQPGATYRQNLKTRAKRLSNFAPYIAAPAAAFGLGAAAIAGHKFGLRAASLAGSASALGVAGLVSGSMDINPVSRDDVAYGATRPWLTLSPWLTGVEREEKAKLEKKPSKKAAKLNKAAFDPDKHKRGKGGRFSALEGPGGAALFGAAAALGAVGGAHGVHYAARPIVTRKRSEALRAYRRELTDAKAAGSVIMYRGAPAADPNPRARAFNAVYAATEKDIGRMYGKVVNRYALTPGARLLSMHHDDVKPLFDPSMHAELPKKATDRVGQDHRLWRLTDEQHKTLTDMGYTGVEVPQLDRHDAYAISNEKSLRYLGAGYRGGKSGSRVLRLTNLARLMPKRYLPAVALGGAVPGLIAGDLISDPKTKDRTKDILSNAAAASTVIGSIALTHGLVTGAVKTGMLGYRPGTNMATYRRAVLNNGLRFSGKSFRTVGKIGLLDAARTVTIPVLTQATMTYLNQLRRKNKTSGVSFKDNVETRVKLLTNNAQYLGLASGIFGAAILGRGLKNPAARAVTAIPAAGGMLALGTYMLSVPGITHKDVEYAKARPYFTLRPWFPQISTKRRKAEIAQYKAAKKPAGILKKAAFGALGAKLGAAGSRFGAHVGGALEANTAPKDSILHDAGKHIGAFATREARHLIRNPISYAQKAMGEGARFGSGFATGVGKELGMKPKRIKGLARVGAIAGSTKLGVGLGLVAGKPAYHAIRALVSPAAPAQPKPGAGGQ